MGNCCVALTSRNSLQLADVRQYMDTEVEIIGFGEAGIGEYASKYLNDCKKSENLVKHLHDTGTESIVKVPILLQMTCVLSEGKESLPSTKGGIIDAMIQRSIKKETIRNQRTTDHGHAQNSLLRLGKLAWNTLKQGTRQLLLEQVCSINHMIGFY